MSVIPLTLTISLCLVFTFIVFFLLETSRRRFSSAERESLLPLAEETGRVVEDSASKHDHHHKDNCGCRSGKRAPCANCLKGHSHSHR